MTQWEPWHSSLYCEPLYTVQGGPVFKGNYLAYAPTEKQAELTVKLHLGVRLLTMGADVDWLRHSEDR